MSVIDIAIQLVSEIFEIKRFLLTCLWWLQEELKYTNRFLEFGFYCCLQKTTFFCQKSSIDSFQKNFHGCHTYNQGWRYEEKKEMKLKYLSKLTQ